VKYGIQTQLPNGAKTYSSSCDEAVVTRINDEYQRTTCGFPALWKTDYFDLSGRLIRRENDDYKITLYYNGKNPDRIEDSLGQKLFLKWTSAWHVADARTESPEPVMNYSYGEKGNLLVANRADGISFRYEYNDNNNLTKIIYVDNSHMDMQYDKNSAITSVTERNGSKTLYTYRYDPKSPTSHYWTTTTQISASGAQTSKEEEYFLATDAVGVEQLAGFSKTEDKRKQAILFDERRRIKLVKNKYGGFAEYFYHPTLNKIRAVVTDEGSTVFTYDKAGNLIRAFSTKDQLITLNYDTKKRISKIVELNKAESTKRTLTFKYNAADKPINIKLIGKGEIKVEYDQLGEISKVESKQGSKMAFEVTEAFQTLLLIVKSANVDLSL